ncbi:MAG: tetratricopeptide repeat protein [Burkholderiaceae bacterium]|nr:tetratricopeptide repeat protein [Burkholderiaceae bacterium]
MGTISRSPATLRWARAFAPLCLVLGAQNIGAQGLISPTDSSGISSPQSQPPRSGLMPGRPMAPAVSPDITEARELISNRKWSEAEQLIESRLAKRPRDPQWRFLQGVLFAETGRQPEAISVFELLTEDFPELSESYNNLAALYVEQRELNKARLLLERAVQNRPDYALAHENLGDIFTQLAIQSYEKAAKSNQPAPSVKLKLDHLLKTPAIRTSRVTTNR